MDTVLYLERKNINIRIFRDNACHALLDLGDIDYFHGEKLALLNAWIEKNYKSDNEDLNEILRKLKEYVEKAIELDSGVIIEL